MVSCTPPAPLPREVGLSTAVSSSPSALVGSSDVLAPKFSKSGENRTRDVQTSEESVTIDTRQGAVGLEPLSKSKAVEPEVARLAQRLTVGIEGPKDKARALYDWVTKEISYDTEFFRTGVFPDPDPAKVLVSRKAVCEGYSRLFVDLARAVGVEAVMVPGYSKGFLPGDDQKKESDPDHAWVATRWDGAWHLIDPTWGAGFIDPGRNFVAKPSGDWFDVPPQIFVASHLPSEVSWQLLEAPIPAQTFWSAPTVSLLKFEYGLKLESHPLGLIQSSGPFEVKVSSTKPCHLMATFIQEGMPDQDGATLVERRGKEFIIHVAPPQAGRYRLLLLVGPTNSKKTESAVSYDVDARSGVSWSYPKAFGAFAQHEAQLLAPRSDLKKGQAADFLLKVPGANEVMAVIDDVNYRFSHHDDSFRLKLIPTGKNVTIFASFDRLEDFHGLLEFRVNP